MWQYREKGFSDAAEGRVQGSFDCALPSLREDKAPLRMTELFWAGLAFLAGRPWFARYCGPNPSTRLKAGSFAYCAKGCPRTSGSLTKSSGFHKEIRGQAAIKRRTQS